MQRQDKRTHRDHTIVNGTYQDCLCHNLSRQGDITQEPAIRIAQFNFEVKIFPLIHLVPAEQYAVGD